MSLSKKGLQLRNAIATAGVELTPDELEDSIKDAIERISCGPCIFCGEEKELRYGGCFDCVIGKPISQKGGER